MRHIIALSFILLPGAQGLVAQDTASFFGLGPSAFSATGVSSDGSVVVGNSNPQGSGYWWTDSAGVQPMGSFAGMTSYSVNGVSGDGSTIIGNAGGPAGVVAYKWSGGNFVDLGTLPGGLVNNVARAVSTDGSVVAGYGINGDSIYEAWRWNGSMQGLGYLPGGNSSITWDISPDGNVIVGRDRIYPVPNEPVTVACFSVGGGALQSLAAGGILQSDALAVSDSGKVIVGIVRMDDSGVVYPARWTAAGGWEIMKGDSVNRVPIDVSADGSIAVGYHNAFPSAAFIWTESAGIRDLKQVLETDYGLDLTGWTLSNAYAVSDDGTTIVGIGLAPGGTAQAWVARIPAGVSRPRPGETWIAGTTDTIRWSLPGVDTVAIGYSTDFENGAGTFQTIVPGIPAAPGMYLWSIPDTLLSRRCAIRVSDVNDPLDFRSSGIFRIKPYVLTKTTPSGDYLDYQPASNEWWFANYADHMWPPSWYTRFNYLGPDPFTNMQYSVWQGGVVFPLTPSSAHPDWVSFVNTFSVPACYVSVDLGIYSPTAVSRWDLNNGVWGGSCFGIAVSNAIVFRNKSDFLARYTAFPDFNLPIDVGSDENVITVVNELFTHQLGNPHLAIRESSGLLKTPNETLHELKAMFASEDAPVRTLSFVGNGPNQGGHAILAWGLRQDTALPNLYFVRVYDNAYPDSLNAQIVVDTALNGGNGGWSNSLWPGWGGTEYFYLRDPAVNYLSTPTIPKAASVSRTSPFILSAGELVIGQKGAGSVRIEDTLGRLSGYIGGVITRGIPGSFPLVVEDGSAHPPYGYILDSGPVSVAMSGLSDNGAVKAFFLTGNRTFTAGRSGALPADTDRFFFDGGLTALNTDPAIKTFGFYTIVNESVREKTFRLDSVELSTGDSLRLEFSGFDTLKIVSNGSSGKSYDLEVALYADTGLGRFLADDIALGAGLVSHTLDPDWGDLDGQILRILIDAGDDGSIDDTLELSNQLTGVDDDRYAGTPAGYRLDQNYPNPFNSSTAIRYQVPAGGHVGLRVYDLLGRLVATLVNREVPPGYHSVEWDAAGLPSGVYLCRLTSGRFSEERKMILSR